MEDLQKVCCDLLEIQYLCRCNNNIVRCDSLRGAVVIC